MRIAIISDIHGNPIALDAVLADAGSLGVEQFWMIGDVCALGPDPIAALERVATLPNARFTRGNTDRYVVTGERPPPHLQAVRARPELLETYAGIAASFAWTAAHVTACGWTDWLARLPLELRATLAGDVRVLAVHASPGSDDGEGVHAGRSNAELAALLAGGDADVILVGHTHEPLLRRIDGVWLVNVGSVSNPKTRDVRASYVLLEAGAAGIELVHRRVAYDNDAFIAAVRRSRHPAADFILAFQRGEQLGPPPHADHTPIVEGERVLLSARAAQP